MRLSIAVLLAVLCGCSQQREGGDDVGASKRFQRLFQHIREPEKYHVDYGFGFVSDSKAWFSDSQSKDKVNIVVYSIIQRRQRQVASYNKIRNSLGCSKWIFPMENGESWIVAGEMWLDHIRGKTITRNEVKRGDGEWGCGAGDVGCGNCNWGVDIDTDRKNLVILSDHTGRVEIVNIEQALSVTTRRLRGIRGYLDIKFSPDGSLIADNIDGLNLTDVKTKELTALGKGQERELNAGQLDFWGDSLLVYSKRNYDYSRYKQAMVAADEEPMGDYKQESLIKNLGKETLMLLDLKQQKSRPLVTVKGEIVDIAGSDRGERLVFATDSQQLCAIERKKTTGTENSAIVEISRGQSYNEEIAGGRFLLRCMTVQGKSEIRRLEISPKGGYAMTREKTGAVSLWSIAR